MSIDSHKYKHEVVPIEKFLTPEVMGKEANQLFYVWRKHLIDHFSPDNKINEWVVGGSIGSGRTTFSNLASIYNLYKVCCLRNPQRTLNTRIDSPLVQLIYTAAPKIDQALTLKPFLEQLREVKLFREVKKVSQFGEVEDAGLIPFCVFYGTNEIKFPHNIVVYCGPSSKSPEHAVFGVIVDEEIKGFSDFLSAYTNLVERTKSRFLENEHALIFLVRSAQHPNSQVSKYVSRIDGGDNATTKYVEYPIWEVRNFDAYKDGHFYVMRGNLTYPAKVLDDIEEEEYNSGKFQMPTGCEIIKVPMVYKHDFMMRVNKSLERFAGVYI